MTFNILKDFSQDESYPSYDWFVATVFLIFKGDKQQTIKFSLNGINLSLPTTCQFIELILKIEQPLVFSAFRMSGIAPSQICSHWLKQCFWNYLDWNDIMLYLSICIIFGIDYQAYVCVAVLKHLNQNQTIVQHHTYKDLQIFLKVSFNLL